MRSCVLCKKPESDHMQHSEYLAGSLSGSQQSRRLGPEASWETRATDAKKSFKEFSGWFNNLGATKRVRRFEKSSGADQLLASKLHRSLCSKDLDLLCASRTTSACPDERI